MEKLIQILFITELLFLTACYTGEDNDKNHNKKEQQIQNVLNAPGNYLKNTVGQIERVKETKKLAEKVQQDRIKSSNLGD